MRAMIFFLLLLAKLSASAQVNPSLYLKPFSFGYCLPLGEMTKIQGVNSMPGRITPSICVDGTFQMKFKNNWIYGLGYQYSEFKYDSSSATKWMLNKYQKEGYYQKITNNNYYASIFTISLIASKEFDLKYLTIAPYLNLGVGIYSGIARMTIYQKKFNDNYWEDITVFNEGKTSGGVSRAFFFPNVGVNVSKKVFRCVHVTGNIYYGYGRMNYKTKERTTDFLNVSKSKDLQFKQNISVLNASIGIELRFRKKLSKEEKAKYNIK